MPKRPPSYRQPKGYDQAIVTLTDTRTGKRRDYWLGPHSSAESRERYHRLLAEWEANGRVLPEPSDEGSSSRSRTTASEIIYAYWVWAQTYFNSASEIGNIRIAARLMRQFYGQTPAASFVDWWPLT